MSCIPTVKRGVTALTSLSVCGWYYISNRNNYRRLTCLYFSVYDSSPHLESASSFSRTTRIFWTHQVDCPSGFTACFSVIFWRATWNSFGFDIKIQCIVLFLLVGTLWLVQFSINNAAGFHFSAFDEVPQLYACHFVSVISWSITSLRSFQPMYAADPFWVVSNYLKSVREEKIPVLVYVGYFRSQLTSVL